MLRLQQNGEAIEQVPDIAAIVEHFEALLQAVAAVAIGDIRQRGEIEGMLVDLESHGWHLYEVVHRIWRGERDEAKLTEGLDAQDTALIQRVLEIIALLAPVGAVAEKEIATSTSANVQHFTTGQFVNTLPATIVDAILRQDLDTIMQTIPNLTPEEQQSVGVAAAYLAKRQAMHGNPDDSVLAHITQLFEEHLYTFATIAAGDTTYQQAMVAYLIDWEKGGWHLKDSIERLWNGERDIATLTERLDVHDAAFIRRVLETLTAFTSIVTLTEGLEPKPKILTPHQRALEIYPLFSDAGDKDPEQIIRSLPRAIREAIEHGDNMAFLQALQELSSEEQQRIEEVIHFLQRIRRETRARYKLQVHSKEDFDSLLGAIAVVSVGDTTN